MLILVRCELFLGRRKSLRSNGALPVTCLLSLLVFLHRPAEVTSPAVGVECPPTCRCRDGTGSGTGTGSETGTGSGAVAVTCHRSDLVHVPRLPEATVVLDLDHNHISLLQNRSLHGVPRLRTLSVQDNGILHLEPGVFDRLPGLRELRLGRNHLSGFPPNVFAGCRLLELIDLHANYFAQVPDGAVHSLFSLQVLNMSFNQLTSADLGAGFRYTTRLSVIDFSGNDLSSLESTSFEVMSSWDDGSERHINLSYCNLRHIDPLSFRPIPRLASLSLEGNPRVPQPVLQSALKNTDVTLLRSADFSHMNITDVAAFVHDFQATALVRLELSYNRLKVVPKGTFFFFVSLRHLGLGHNEISTVENLAGLSRLEYLDLAYNSIQRLDEMMFEGLHELKVLDVSHNAISRIDDTPFLNLFNLHTVDISNNQVYQFQISDGLESLETLRAGWNRLSNVRFLQRLRRLSAIHLCHNAVTRLGEELFARGQRIAYANFSNNVIADVSPNAFRSGEYDVLDLSHNRLTTLTHHGWQSVRVLYLNDNLLHNITSNSLRNMNHLREVHLQNNRLRALPRQLFADLRNLTHLDLSLNPIGSCLELADTARTFSKLERLEILRIQGTSLVRLGDALLRNLTSLRQLDASDNRLTRLAPDTLPLLSRLDVLDLSNNGFREFPVEILAARKSSGNSRSVDLSGNPFDCSCDLVPLCQRLFASSKDIHVTVDRIDNRTLYQCASPIEWTGVPVSEFYDTASRQCTYFERAVIYVIVGSILAAVLVVALVTGCRYRAWRRRKKQRGRASAGAGAGTGASRPSLGYKFVDETSLTSSSNSSSNNGGQGGAVPPAPTTACLLSKQWV